MDYRALAADYDGTLAKDGHVSKRTIAALRKWRESGRRVLLVTGRELPELQCAFPELDLCERVVAENGALLFNPATGEERLLGTPPPDAFLTEVHQRGVAPFSVGRVIFATWKPHETVVLDVIRELGLEYHIIFNKRAVMVLPSGINKAVGLTAALRDLEFPAEAVVGVGDAENDHSFLEVCGYAVAVSNALPALKERCDLVTRGDHGDGVSELIDHLLAKGMKAGVFREREASP